MLSEKLKIGTVGLGLMGCSIATCILAAGHNVTSIIKDLSEINAAHERIREFLLQLKSEGLIDADADEILKRHVISTDISKLAGHEVVIETITEDVAEKKKLYQQLEEVIAEDAIIGSNTSAIPVSILQAGMKYPARLLGIHWAEPAHITRFMEVICGDATDIKHAYKIVALAEGWNKEPSLIKKDIRGFITNRVMYAMIREAMFLVENGYATIADVDRSLRNDLGYWITFAGPFRFMDLTGIPAYLKVMEELLPELDHSTKPSSIIKELVDSGAKGVSNAKGFYTYDKASAERWEKLFINFSYDIRKLAEKYPQNAGDV